MRTLLIILALLLATACTVKLPFIAMPLSMDTAGDAEHGAQIFAEGVNGSPPCRTCHQVVPGATGFSLGPNLSGVGERAAHRVEGWSAEEYIRQSILDPHAYVVSGYRDVMYPEYHTHFSDDDLNDLIAYLMTLSAAA